MKFLIETFYKAFDNLDAKTMCACYHEDIVFEDPAFGKLKGERAKAMWQMLCESQKGKNFRVKVSNINTTETEATAYWEAFYVFSKSGRKVHNTIDAQFKFKDGLIVFHKDNFNLHKWARQALGFKGLVMGGTAFFRNKLKTQTNRLLDKYIDEKKLPR